MKENEDDILIHPEKGRKEKSLPERAILVANPAEARIAQEEMRLHGAQPRFLYNSQLLVDQDLRLCLAGPSLGAPAAGLIFEKLIALGVTKISLFSCCGAINRDYSIGDVMIAVSGVSGEGVSRYYGGIQEKPVSDEETERLRMFLKNLKMSWREGGVWSTDAPYRESRSGLNRLHLEYGIDGVDMEFTALCSIASFRKVHLSALFVVSDELWGPDWKPGFTDTVYRDRCKSLISALIRHNLEEGKKND